MALHGRKIYTTCHWGCQPTASCGMPGTTQHPIKTDMLSLVPELPYCFPVRSFTPTVLSIYKVPASTGGDPTGSPTQLEPKRSKRSCTRITNPIGLRRVVMITSIRCARKSGMKTVYDIYCLFDWCITVYTVFSALSMSMLSFMTS